MRFQKQRVNIWYAIVVVIVLISLIVVYVQTQKQMSVYTGDTEASSSEPEKPEIPLKTYTNEEYNYSIGIPEDWKYVTKDGFDTYIHSASATSVQIQINNYNPNILNITQESISAELNNSGCVLSNFGWADNSCYSVIYSKPSGSGDNVTNYMEITYFDRATIIRVVYMINSKYYDRLQDTITAIIDSFSWNKQRPIPEKTRMIYVPAGNFEFAYPDEWTIGTSGSAYVAQDSKTGAAMSVSATESTATYKDLSKLDYTNFAAQSRNNFVLQAYNADANVIYAQATYTYNNTDMVLTQYLIATGKYEYALTFETTTEAYSVQAELFQNIINTFRIFD